MCGVIRSSPCLVQTMQSFVALIHFSESIHLVHVNELVSKKYSLIHLSHYSSFPRNILHGFFSTAVQVIIEASSKHGSCM